MIFSINLTTVPTRKTYLTEKVQFLLLLFRNSKNINVTKTINSEVKFNYYLEFREYNFCQRFQ